MNQKTLYKWMVAHALVLFVLFSVLLVVKKSPDGNQDFPWLPSSAKQSIFGERLTTFMSAVSSDQWIYYHQAQFILYGRVDRNFLAYKAKNDPFIQSSDPKNFHLPYRDISFEYPPFSLVPILLPGLLTSDFYTYRILFSILASTFYLLTLWIFFKIYRDLPKDRFQDESLGKILLCSFLFLLFMGPLVVYRLDIFATFLMIMALRNVQKENPILTGLFLALGIALKLYPLILCPLIVFYWIKQKTSKSVGMFALSLTLTLLSIYLPVLFIAREGFLHSLAYHGQRGVELESLYATWAQILYLLGSPAEVYEKFGSLNIHWSGEAWVTKHWALMAMGLMGLVYVRYLLCRGRPACLPYELASDRKPADPTGSNGGKIKGEHIGSPLQKKGFEFYNLIESSFLLILALLITSKVLSPQFIIWLFPLFLFVGTQRPKIFPLMLQIALASQMIYPYLFVQLNFLDPFTIVVLAWRNLLLVALFLMMMDWGLIFKGIRFRGSIER